MGDLSSFMMGFACGVGFAWVALIFAWVALILAKEWSER